jgi:CRISPR-associated endonuclease/helicase Cas3
MISSATIAPAIAEGLFEAYQEGWRQFARFRNRSPWITSFWVDEFSAVPFRISSESDFKESHLNFINQRVRTLERTSIALRSAVVGKVVANDPTNLHEQWYEQVSKFAFELHDRHGQLHKESGKRVSIGIIRVANVDPCIDLTRHLLGCELPDDVDIRVMPYHARQVQLLRSEQERHLDQVLNRKNERDPLSNAILAKHLRSTDKPNVLFVVVATPVAEVGRDHDYDWAIVEPSSMRSIIQMAGRVYRHRTAQEDSRFPNVVLPELNLKAFTTSGSVVFEHPGFEGGQSSRGGGYRLYSKNLHDIIDTVSLEKRLDATARITCPVDLKPVGNLVHLEHQVLRNILIARDFRPAFAKGWNACAYYLTDVSQRVSPFRKTAEDSIYKLHISDDDQLIFRHPDTSTERSSALNSKSVSHIHFGELPVNHLKRLWLTLDYQEQINRQQQLLGMSSRSVCNFLGEIRLIDQEGQDPFIWHPALGARRGSSYP